MKIDFEEESKFVKDSSKKQGQRVSSSSVKETQRFQGDVHSIWWTIHEQKRHQDEKTWSLLIYLAEFKTEM